MSSSFSTAREIQAIRNDHGSDALEAADMEAASGPIRSTGVSRRARSASAAGLGGRKLKSTLKKPMTRAGREAEAIYEGKDVNAEEGTSTSKPMDPKVKPAPKPIGRPRKVPLDLDVNARRRVLDSLSPAPDSEPEREELKRQVRRDRRRERERRKELADLEIGFGGMEKRFDEQDIGLRAGEHETAQKAFASGSTDVRANKKPLRDRTRPTSTMTTFPDPAAEVDGEVLNQMNAEVDELASSSAEEYASAMEVSAEEDASEDEEDEVFGGKAARAKMKVTLSKFKYGASLHGPPSGTGSRSSLPDAPSTSKPKSSLSKPLQFEKRPKSTTAAGLAALGNKKAWKKEELEKTYPMPATEKMMKTLTGCVVCLVGWKSGQQIKTKWQHMIQCHQDQAALHPEKPPLNEIVLDVLRKNANAIGIGIGIHQPIGGRSTIAEDPSDATLLQNVAGGANLGIGGVHGILPDAAAIQKKKLASRKRATKAAKMEMKALFTGGPAIVTMTQGRTDEVAHRLQELCSTEEDSDAAGNGGGNDLMDEGDDDLESEDGMNSFAARKVAAVKARRSRGDHLISRAIRHKSKENIPTDLDRSDQDMEVDPLFASPCSVQKAHEPAMTQKFNPSKLGGRLSGKPTMFATNKATEMRVGETSTRNEMSNAGNEGDKPVAQGKALSVTVYKQLETTSDEDVEHARSHGPDIHLSDNEGDGVISIYASSQPTDYGNPAERTRNRDSLDSRQAPVIPTVSNPAAHTIDLVDLTSPCRPGKSSPKRRLSAISLSESDGCPSSATRKRLSSDRVIVEACRDALRVESPDPDLGFVLDELDDACLVWDGGFPDDVADLSEGDTEDYGDVVPPIPERETNASAVAHPKRAKLIKAQKAEMVAQGVHQGVHAPEAVAQKIARGMPRYGEWTLADLQAGVTKYGFKSSKVRKTMERQLEECWSQLHPVINKQRKAIKKPKRPSGVLELAGGQQSGDSSDEVPLAEAVPKRTRGKAQPKEPKPAVLSDQQLCDEFSRILLEPERYARVLLYEPLPFDELITVATERGITRVGWKLHLRKYLDEQGIAFYSEEQQGSRKRH